MRSPLVLRLPGLQLQPLSSCLQPFPELLPALGSCWWAGDASVRRAGGLRQPCCPSQGGTNPRICAEEQKLPWFRCPRGCNAKPCCAVGAGVGTAARSPCAQGRGRGISFSQLLAPSCRDTSLWKPPPLAGLGGSCPAPGWKPAEEPSTSVGTHGRGGDAALPCLGNWDLSPPAADVQTSQLGSGLGFLLCFVLSFLAAPWCWVVSLPGARRAGQVVVKLQIRPRIPFVTKRML